MTSDQIIISSILTLLVAGLIWGRWRYDVVAVLALIATVVTGLVPAETAFDGFGHPATITVAAVLILSRALATAGAMTLAARLVTRAGASTSAQIGALASLAGPLSGFMNNVGTLGLLMPVALEAARKAGRSPSLLLMPLSFACILGGLITLIGTPPNIIVATYRGTLSGAPFEMFDFTPVGGSVALVGLAFVALVGWRLVPRQARQRVSSEDFFEIQDYVTEVRLPEGSKLEGCQLREVDQLVGDLDLLVLGLIRGKSRRPASPGHEVLREGDIVIVEMSAKDLDQFVAGFGLELVGERGGAASLVQSGELQLVEAVVKPRSRIEGRSVASLYLPRRYGASIVAVSRLGKSHRGRLRNFRLRAGDVLLIYGEADALPELITRLDCLPLAQRALALGRRRQAPWVIAVFALAILLASLGLLSVTVALVGAVAAMVLLNLISVRELYDGVDWPVIVLLGALIPVGGALQSTETTRVMAEAILTLTAGLPAFAVLGILLVVVMTLSDVLNNAATAVVMAPVGAGLAARLEVSADPFLMAVAIGASCAFLTPIGHQNNALVMGPGGYRFGDYWRMGLPLEILIVAVSLPMILVVWPL